MKKVLIFFISFIIFFVVCFLIFIASAITLFNFANDPDYLRMRDSISKAEKKEKLRIESLPVLAGVIIDDDTNYSPFLKEKSALTLLNLCGVSEIRKSGRPFKKGDTSDRHVGDKLFPYVDYFFGYRKDSIILEINKKRIKVSLDSLLIIPPVNDGVINKNGKIDLAFKSSARDNSFLLDGEKFIDTEERRLYFKNFQKLQEFNDRYPVLEKYYVYWTDRAKYHRTDWKVQEWCYGFAFREYNLKKGDTLRFKGKIQQGKVINLF